MTLAPLAKEDLKHLGADLVRFLLLLTTGIGVAAFAWHLHSSADAAYRHAVAVSRSTPASQGNALQRARSIIGPENHQAWTNGLASLEATHRSTPAEVEWLPSRPLSQGPGFVLMGSPMRLRLQLRHEEELLKLIDQFQRVESAWVRPTRCTVRRQPPGSFPSLTADCQFDWIHAEERP